MHSCEGQISGASFGGKGFVAGVSDIGSCLKYRTNMGGSVAEIAFTTGKYRDGGYKRKVSGCYRDKFRLGLWVACICVFASVQRYLDVYILRYSGAYW